MDFVFLISAKSNRYYTSKGHFKTVSPDNPRDGWFYGTLKSGKKLDININIAEDSKQVMAYINILVGSVENPVGVAGAGLNLTSLSKQLRTTKLSKNSIAYLISKDGGIYAHPEEKYTSEIKNIKNIKDNDFQRIITPAILNDNEGTRSYTDSSGIEKIVVFQTIKSSNWKIIFEIPKNELGKESRKKKHFYFRFGHNKTKHYYWFVCCGPLFFFAKLFLCIKKLNQYAVHPVLQALPVV
ncbi:MAG: hypothetical protein GY714_03705 [Desulfobacterales bacterium]|nr:hypothetical protein [Desulfobacterales bacterium]